MTPEQIIEMAKQAEISVPPYFNAVAAARLTELQAFAQLVRNAALEEAAKVCEVNHHTVRPSPDSFECAAGIRSLKL